MICAFNSAVFFNVMILSFVEYDHNQVLQIGAIDCHMSRIQVLLQKVYERV